MRRTIAAAAFLAVAALSRGSEGGGPLPSALFIRAAALPPGEAVVRAETAAFPSLDLRARAPAPDLQWAEEDTIKAYEKAFLSDRRDWLLGSLERMRHYRRHVARRVEELGLPREILYLPLVESGYMADAVSPQGAMGPWQLMRATAVAYGVRVDLWLDERRDFLKSTEAALRLLKMNYDVFGDWLLAVAAYNCGAGYLLSVVKSSGVRGFWELRAKGLLPRETAGFVPQLLAVSRIASRPALYGLPAVWEEDAEWGTVSVGRSVDLRILAREADIPYDVLARGNAELAYPLTPPRSYGWLLKVPAARKAAAEAALAASPESLVEFGLHRIASGDTLWRIATDNRITVELLLEFNPGVSPQALRIGSVLVVPLARRARG